MITTGIRKQNWQTRREFSFRSFLGKTTYGKREYGNKFFKAIHTCISLRKSLYPEWYRYPNLKPLINSRGWQTITCHLFLNKVLLDLATLTCLYIVYNCFHTTMVELHSCNRDSVSQSGNIH